MNILTMALNPERAKLVMALSVNVLGIRLLRNYRGERGLIRSSNDKTVG